MEEDDGIYWSVNMERFEQFFRDQSIVNAITKKYGATYGEITRAMLRISEATTSYPAHRTSPISVSEITRTLRPGLSLADKVRSFICIQEQNTGRLPSTSFIK